jgi:hypothetical protein
LSFLVYQVRARRIAVTAVSVAPSCNRKPNAPALVIGETYWAEGAVVLGGGCCCRGWWRLQAYGNNVAWRYTRRSRFRGRRIKSSGRIRLQRKEYVRLLNQLRKPKVAHSFQSSAAATYEGCVVGHLSMGFSLAAGARLRREIVARQSVATNRDLSSRLPICSGNSAG